MNPPNNNRDPRRRRYHPPSVGTMVSTAVVAYGVYRLGNWAWNSFLTNNEEDEENIEQDQYHSERNYQSASRSSSPDHGVTANNNSMTDMLRNVMSGVGKQSQQQSRNNNTNNNRRRQLHWKLRRQRLDRCRHETMKTMEEFLPTLENILQGETCTKDETQGLKKLRIQKQHYQQQLKDENNNSDEEEEEDHNTAMSSSMDSIRQEEQDLWNSIKIKTFTKVVGTAYAHTILFLVLTVQVHLLGGRLFEEQFLQAEQTHNNNNNGHDRYVESQQQQQQHTQNDGEEEEEEGASSTVPRTTTTSASNQMASYQSSHKMVLRHTYEYFFDQGVASLVRCVKRAVETVLLDWDVMDPKRTVSEQDIEDALVQIRDIVEGRGGRVARNPSSPSRRPSPPTGRHHHHQRSILKFLLPPEHEDYTILLDDMAQYILDETWDLMESPVMQDAQSACLDATFHQMQESCWSNIFLQNPQQNNDNTGSASNWIVTTKPLANVVTQLKRTFKSFFVKPQGNDNEGSGGGGGSGSDIHNGLRMLSPSNERLECNMYCSILERIPTVLELGDVSFN